MGQKLGALSPFGEGAGSPSNTKSPGRRPTSIPSGILIHAAIWPEQIWAENWGGLCPIGGRGAGSLSNTMWAGPRPTCVPNFILIHPTVWPQYTNVTDRTGQTGQRSDSIGRTVLQTVAQNYPNFELARQVSIKFGDQMLVTQTVFIGGQQFLYACSGRSEKHYHKFQDTTLSQEWLEIFEPNLACGRRLPWMTILSNLVTKYK